MSTSTIIPPPCPFCGHQDVSVVEGGTFRWVHAVCNRCGVTAGEVRKQTLPTP